MFQEEISVENSNWKKIQERDYEKIAVYTNGEEFLRLGKKEILEPECTKQEHLVAQGFPLPPITKTGEYNELWYFIEPSFGTTLYTYVFSDECKKHGNISQKTFDKFLRICLELTEAQLNNPLSHKNEESLKTGVHFNVMLEELPKEKEKLEKAYSKATHNLSMLPWTTNLGDFTSHNMLEKGAIDLGASFEGPVGYDQVSAICHIENFPYEQEYEISRGYWFSKQHIQQYMSAMDELFITHNLETLSKFLSDFIFLRTLWTAVRMDHLPKLQQWRYNYTKEVLQKYLEDKDLSLPHANPPLDNFS